MIGIFFMFTGIAIILLAVDNILQNKRIKKLENEVKKINNPYNLDL